MVIERKIKGGIEVTGRRGKDVESYWMSLRKGENTHI
jgi:hypothetical protein